MTRLGSSFNCLSKKLSGISKDTHTEQPGIGTDTQIDRDTVTPTCERHVTETNGWTNEMLLVYWINLTAIASRSFVSFVPSVV